MTSIPSSGRAPLRDGRATRHGIVSPIFDFDLMRTLASIAEEGSFTRAGERLGLTQQAISAQVKRLEESINRPVLVRGGGRVRLTADGETLLAYAKRALAISDQVRLHFAATPISGSLRIGILEGFATHGLPLLLASLQSSHPNLDIRVEAGFTEKLVLRQDNDGLDLVLGAQRKGRGLGETLWEDRFRWVGDVRPFAQKLQPVRLVMQPEPSLTRALAVEALVREARPYSIMFESESRASLRAAALAGVGAAVFCSFDEPLDMPEANEWPELDPIEYFLRIKDPQNAVVDEVAKLIRDLSPQAVLRG